MGANLGILFSLSILLQFTKEMDPRHSWGMMSTILVIFAMISLAMVSEVMEVPSQNICSKLKQLSKEAYLECKRNKNLLFGYIICMIVAGPQVVIEIYLYSWLSSFHDGENPKLKSKAEVLDLYQIQGIIGMIVAFIFLLAVGSIIDKVPFKIMMPLGLSFRALVFFMIYRI